MSGNPTHNLFSPYFVDYSELSPRQMEIFQDKIDRLPPTLFAPLVGAGSVVAINTIVEHYTLSVGQGSEIARIMRDTLLGDLFIEDFENALVNRLGVNHNLAVAIKQYLLEQILEPLLGDLRTGRTGNFLPHPAPPETIHHSTIPGADLPETGGNIIDLRDQN